MEAKLKRHITLADTRRTLVLEAAKSAFAQVGLERTSMREIAKRSGYTPGALYAFFSSKHDVLRSLLESSLSELGAAVEDTKPLKGRADGAFAARAQAWFDWLERHPRDAALLLQMLAPSKAGVSTPEAATPTYNIVAQTLAPCAASLEELGAVSEDIAVELAGLLAQGLGLLMLPASGSGLPASVLFARAADQLVWRLLGANPQATLVEDFAASQTDLFA